MKSLIESQCVEITEDVPLVVDLDGTLLRTDSLWESVLVLAKKRWYALAFLPLWFFKGKAYLKWRVAQLVDLPITNLPFNERFLSFLKEQRAKERTIILATAANEKVACAVAKHVGCFDAVMASDQNLNLSGARKLAKIQAALNGSPFDYAGNEKADIAIWASARRAVLVNPTRLAALRAPQVTQIERVFSDDKRTPYAYLGALRLYQWPKNFLVFLPILTAHVITDSTALGNSALAFFCWSLCASSVYVINDLLDLESDRLHPKKRSRPFAAGVIPLTHGLFLIPILLSGCFSLSLLLPRRFLVILALYLIVAVVYSSVIKKIIMLDVVTIAALYTLRVIGGAEAASIVPTFWLLAFSMFLFLHLALVKRYADLLVLQSHSKSAAEGRDYKILDLPSLVSLGSSAGYLAVLVLALYINSPEIQLMYSHPKAVWLLCPLLLYWTGRIWVKTVRGEMHHDPLIYALRDRASWVVVACALTVLVIAV